MTNNSQCYCLRLRKFKNQKRPYLLITGSEGKVNDIFRISKWEIVFQVEVTNPVENVIRTDLIISIIHLKCLWARQC